MRTDRLRRGLLTSRGLDVSLAEDQPQADGSSTCAPSTIGMPALYALAVNVERTLSGRSVSRAKHLVDSHRSRCQDTD